MADTQVLYQTVASRSPSGLTVTRNGNNVSFGWTIPSAKYKEQQLQYRLKESGAWGKWISLEVGATTKARKIVLNPNNYWPVQDATKQLHGLQFRVRGKTKDNSVTKNQTRTEYTYTYSDWASKSWDVLVPKKPKITSELETSNATRFAWDANADVKSNRWFTDVAWQAMLVKDCTETDGSKLKWKTSATGWLAGTGGTSGSRLITEDTATLAAGSYTRWFRAVARGPEGHDGWVYAKHVYAQPNQADVQKTKTKEDESGGIAASMTWEAPATAANPIDETTVQYKIDIPGPDLSCPPGGSWTDVNSSRDTKGKDGVYFVVDDNLDDDECLFTRVNTWHDGVATLGIPQLARKGYLADPSNVQVTINQATHRATITATNNSVVPDSFLVVRMRRGSAPERDVNVGVIPHGSSSVTVQCPSWGASEQVAFGVSACVGAYEKKDRADGSDLYAITKLMWSENIIWDGGTVPVAPQNVKVKGTEMTGTIRVSWDWTWLDADAAELSWADHEDAWESTNEPERYEISNMYAPEWNISGLETGKTWYVRVRLLKGETYGPYSAAKEIDLSSAPLKPVLTLEDTIIKKGEKFTASWVYQSTDATGQAYAELWEVTQTAGVMNFVRYVGHATSAQRVTMDCPKSWQNGETHLLTVQLYSASAQRSGWSDPVAITLAEPPVAGFTTPSLSQITVPADEVTHETRTALSLTEMPLVINATGAGAGGTTLVIVERAEDYKVERPDETEQQGFEGEQIAKHSRIGEGQITITRDMLTGALDDNGKYRVWVIVTDRIGQTDAVSLDFEVHWTQQALMPKAKELIHGSVIEITPIAQEGARTGDTCDIYRLSADKPVLIVESAEFGRTYVDPYPAFGDTGGHRVVYKTINGDYITAEGTPAWIDLMDGFDSDCTVIDFAGEQVILRYDLGLSNSWKKEFSETRYLGGSIQGDWAPGVSRKMSVTSTLITVEDEETIANLRKLAEYTGICHVRTPDGSSFDADIQVTESRSYQTGGRKVDIGLSITRVEPEGLDGMTLEAWEDR